MKNLNILVGVFLLLLSSSLATMAQTPKYEVGGQIFSLQSNQIGYGFGFGARFGYNLTRHVGIDTEYNALVDDEGGAYAHQVFAGVKVGVRNKLGGAFVKVRPGIMTNFNKLAPTFATTFATESINRFALDAGAVFEVYPNRHWMFRVDLSDIIVPFDNEQLLVSRPLRLGTTHNFQYSLGVGLRF